ncbi:transcription-repair coupling factor (superfamily II helicase) [Rhodoligotrophos appendicifer]|uniref:transcription-repair coupling factor n=1 Tax=Rhodoligotrophos appendicifer TaxID=987056 RepID=UPI001184A70A|nr:transcription-repair coupling factor [Rhodoligotrophos appendicifer]
MNTRTDQLQGLFETSGRTILAGTPEGLDALVLGDLARRAATEKRGPVLHLARDDQRMSELADQLSFFAPDIEVLKFPAWDCLPYDRVSPSAGAIAERISTLVALTKGFGARSVIVLSTANAALQRVPQPSTLAGASFRAAPGNVVDIAKLQAFLTQNGFSRTGTVMEPGEYAIRGGIIDIFPPGTDLPLRLDLFGDTLESIRSFDAKTQRSVGQLKQIVLEPASEVLLMETTIARFRTRYTKTFGGQTAHDQLYEAISAGQRYQGMEHWLPLFYDRLATIFDYAKWSAVSLDHQVDESVAARRELIQDFYEARKQALEQATFGAAPYKPLEPNALYLTETEWLDALGAQPALSVSPFERPEGQAARVVSLGGRQGRSFAAERAQQERNVFEALHVHVGELRRAGKRVIISAWSEGSRERLTAILREHHISPVVTTDTWPEVEARERSIVNVVILALETGFETPEFAIIGEQDILGDRLIRRARKKRKASDFLSELSSLSPGDLVVHVDHGIGRFEGLKTIEVQGAPHDCLFLTYAGGDRLFLPVENIELVSRYGSEEAGVQLDKLGGHGWQARKAKLKQRVKEIADQLIKTAAARLLKHGEVIVAPEGIYDEFCARFPYDETDEQLDAITATLEDLQSGRPMDRLICGDVGFGKTEVALRAAFVTAMTGRQVAVVVPTTLLARQHYATFSERFRGFPVRVEQASRLVARKDLNETKKALEEGQVDVIIGTHAILSKTIKFRDLGLLVVDEEQHFGVKHKERLKELRANVHVLTLTATPIPRTLQLAMTGVRDLSLITTPPLDRLAVRTFISPFDPVTIREALLREHYRGGQSFFVCPRVSDLAEMGEFLREHVPEVKFAMAHGQMAPTELEDVMSAFYDRKFDILLSTTIVESGLDIPTANTLIVHRSDMFGLAQLYQIRGRIGRSKQRAYALLTVPAGKPLTPMAERRLKVLQSLDTLGAGFTLASHDLDIRGAGNLLGEEQSGHIKEVGFELYQQMLEEAVVSLRSGDLEVETEDRWSPQINIGTAVLIPENYVADLDLRMGLYRRLADIEVEQEVQGFGAEMRDRFGPLPIEVEHLLQVVSIKLLCRAANVAAVDAGPKGVVVTFRNASFANPIGLVAYINEQGQHAKLRPDQKLVFKRDMDQPEERLKGVRTILKRLVRIVEEAKPVAA